MQTYAGFWRRFVALMIDNIILSIPTGLLATVFMMVQMPQLMAAQTEEEIAAVLPGMFLVSILSNILFFVLFILYTAFMESSSKQATLGKMAMSIKVVDINGQRLNFWHAAGRNLGKVVSYFIIYFGFFMAAFTRRRQALHDIMASTFVVNNSYQAGQPLPQEPFRSGCLVGAIIVVLLPFISLFAAILIPFFVTTNDSLNTDNPAEVRLLQTSMQAIAKINISQEDPLYINGITLYTQDGDVYATRTQPSSFTVRLPKNQTEICCVEDDGDFCQSNAIAKCM